MAERPAVRIDGLRLLRKDLRAFDRTANRELTGDIKRALEPVAERAAQIAPKRTGRLAGSIKPFASGRWAGIRSPVVYANPVHWGWRARGIAAQPFVLQAFAERGDDIVDELGDAIEEHARRHGWR